jgi:NAD(P)-dependent dehydrogenase (short-subunit alcohol dehydrogenase family)
MKVVLSDVEKQPLDAAIDGLRNAGHDVTGAVVDVCDAASVDQLAVHAYQTYGAVHVLCNNAGVVKRARVWELTDDDMTWVLQVNLWGVLCGLRSFVPRMLQQPEGGHIVNTASMASLLPHPNLGAYAAAKSAVLGLTLSLAIELKQMDARIGVSALCPGHIATGITDSARNRPAHLSHEAPPVTGPRTTAGVVPRLTADDVANQVLHAITSNRFWILTHDEYRPVLVDHAQGIGTDAHPEACPIW